jgi:hypothetical protein
MREILAMRYGATRAASADTDQMLGIQQRLSSITDGCGLQECPAHERTTTNLDDRSCTSSSFHDSPKQKTLPVQCVVSRCNPYFICASFMMSAFNRTANQ